MQIKILKKEDINDKKKTRPLYEECFDEGKVEYIDYYYDEIIKRNEMVVLEDDKESVISMIHLNPYLYNIDGYISIVHYLVAVATKKEYRGQGYMNMVMETAINYLNELKEPFCYIVPDNGRLERTYKKYGFEVVSRFVLDKLSKEKYDIFPVKSKEYQNLMEREQYFLDMESEEYKKDLSTKKVMIKILDTSSINVKTIEDIRKKKIYVCQEV